MNPPVYRERDRGRGCRLMDPGDESQKGIPGRGWDRSHWSLGALRGRRVRAGARTMSDRLRGHYDRVFIHGMPIVVADGAAVDETLGYELGARQHCPRGNTAAPDVTSAREWPSALWTFRGVLWARPADGW